MERVDDLQYKGLKIIQSDELFSFGTDAVLLAGFAEVGPKDALCDFGCGTGILSVLLSAEKPRAQYAVEIQEKAAELARRNMELNDIDCRVMTADIKDAPSLFTGVTVIVCNPPYDPEGAGEIQESETVRIARHEVMITLDGICAAAGRLLGTGGRIYMIHRARRAADVICAMRKYRLEPKTIRFVAAKSGDEAGFLLIKAVKDGKSGLSVLPGLIIHKADGSYTDEVRGIYHMEVE